jgi:hypothetical protein
MPFSEDGAERTAAPSARRREASACRFRLQLENVVQAQPERQRRNNSMRSRTIAAIAALAALAAALFVALPASAGNAGTTQISTFDLTGVFTCPGTNYTVLGGTIHSVMHDSFAANGSEHVTGTIAPIGVTLNDGTTDTTYRLSGASWFGGNLDYVNGKYEFGDTEFFNILGPSGGVVAKVAGVEHSGSGGSNFSFSFGQCEAPQD